MITGTIALITGFLLILFILAIRPKDNFISTLVFRVIPGILGLINLFSACVCYGWLQV